MAFTADFEKFKFETDTFVGKRVLITGSGKDGGIGQALALAAAANGARAVGIHFHSSYRDGFDMVECSKGVQDNFQCNYSELFSIVLSYTEYTEMFF